MLGLIDIPGIPRTLTFLKGKEMNLGKWGGEEVGLREVEER